MVAFPDSREGGRDRAIPGIRSEDRPIPRSGGNPPGLPCGPAPSSSRAPPAEEQSGGTPAVGKRAIAVVNLKGGSGKTTTSLSLAVCAAGRRLRVLMLDGDPQANSTMVMLDGEPVKGPTVASLLLGEAQGSEAIVPTRVPGLDIIPADSALADAAVELGDQLGRESRLRRAMRPVEGYDLVLIDAAPELNLVTVNILNYAPELLVPVDPGLFSIAGLARLEDTVREVRTHLENPDVRIIGLVLTRTHANRATKDLEAQLREAYGPLVHRTLIPHSVRVEEAHARHRTVLEFAPRSTPALAYDQLATEILGHVKAATRNAKPPRSKDVA
jgi:chromosome partitioning protein